MPFFHRSLYAGLLTLLMQAGGAGLAAQPMAGYDRRLIDSLSYSLSLPGLTNQAEIETLFRMGLLYTKNGDTDSARFYLRKALAVPGGKRYQGGRIVVNIANAYAFDGQYSEALKYYLEGLHVAEHSKTKGERSNMVRAMANIGECYYNIGSYSQALYYAEQSLEKYTEIGDLSVGYILPQIYYIMGAVYLERGELEAAEENMQRTFDIANDLYEVQKNAGGIAIYNAYGMEGLARVHLHRKEYARAQSCVERAIAYAEEDGDVLVVAKALATLSDIYFALGHYEESKRQALKALEVSPSAVELNPDVAFNIAVAEMFAGNKAQAYRFFQAHAKQMELNTDKNFRETMASLEVQYKTEQQELRIATLELYVGLVAAITLALLLTMGLLFYHHRLAVQRRKIAEQQISQLEQEKELIAARSALDAEKAEREIIARDLHDGVGAMLSVVKNNLNIMASHSSITGGEAGYLSKALDGLDKSIVELRRVAHHIMPAPLAEKGLFAALVDFCRSIPEAEFYCSEPERRFEPEKELVLYRCAYELVNNALRHAQASRIEVHFNTDSEAAYLSVVDNGCGFDPQTAPQGMGIKNLRARLAAFNGSIEIYSEPGKGTEANVELSVCWKNSACQR